MIDRFMLLICLPFEFQLPLTRVIFIDLQPYFRGSFQLYISYTTVVIIAPPSPALIQKDPLPIKRQANQDIGLAIIFHLTANNCHIL